MKEFLGNWGALYFLKEPSLLFLPSAAGFPGRRSFFKVKGFLNERSWLAGNSPWYWCAWVARSWQRQWTSSSLLHPALPSLLCVFRQKWAEGEKGSETGKVQTNFSLKYDLLLHTECWGCCAWGQVGSVFIFLSEVNLSCYWSNDLGKTTWYISGVMGIEPKSWATNSTVQSAQGSGSEIWKCFIFSVAYLPFP